MKPTAQQIVSAWANEQNYSTTTTVDDKRVYFHNGKYFGFAFINFDKLPFILLVASREPARGAFKAAWYLDATFDALIYEKFALYDLNIADPEVFEKIGQVLKYTIESYGGARYA